MLRKCAAVLAVSLVCLSGQAYAQQATSKATTSTVQRVGAKSGQANNQFALTSPFVVFTVFGVVTLAMVASNNSNKSSPISK